MAPNRGSIDQVFESVEVCEILTSVKECMDAIRPIVADLGFSSSSHRAPAPEPTLGASCSSRPLARRLMERYSS